ncbi:hypothetical protein ACFJIW_09955 [Tahibacter sp. UC22_41]|uniref:hypothetical protein n=1 Tax=Tahibacter sp. UC22_41 TaxID=3350178 RepID=UPI0036DAE3BE
MRATTGAATTFPRPIRCIVCCCVELEETRHAQTQHSQTVDTGRNGVDLAQLPLERRQRNAAGGRV